jgi:threonine aldolase
LIPIKIFLLIFGKSDFMKIDFRSDTVTKPSKKMLQYMLDAEVGDDVFGDDPTVNKLQAMAAKMFGKEAAIFCPSGTMTNQIAINVHTQPGDEVICHENAHIYRYEGGGMAKNSGVSPRFLKGNSGLIYSDDIPDCINPDDPHFSKTTLVSLEDTMNKGGGIYYDYEEIKRISKTCKENNLALHLDGARVFNALAETKVNLVEYGSQFDSISICLSKGLGAPVGSLLLGKTDFIKQAIRVRKSFGGGMRQAGFLAAAGIFALEHNVSKLKDDHDKARTIAKALENVSWVEGILPVYTNIVIAKIDPKIGEKRALALLEDQDVLAVAFGKNLIRLVSHLDINENHILEFTSRIKKLN